LKTELDSTIKERLNQQNPSDHGSLSIMKVSIQGKMQEKEKNFSKPAEVETLLKKSFITKMIDVFTKYGSEGWGFPARRRQAGGPARRQAGTPPRFTTNLKPPFLRLFLFFFLCFMYM
jgi:hypothetical protein